MEPVNKNYHLTITTINEVPDQVVPSFFLSLIPSYQNIRDTLTVCKKWYQLKLAIYQKVEQEWPFVRRTQIIHHLFCHNKFYGLPAFFRERNLIDGYLREIPVIYSVVEFMSCWLKQTSEANLINETYGLIGQNVKFDLRQFAIRRSLDLQKSVAFTNYLLGTEQFEAAFAFSENVNVEQKDQISQEIQSFLIENRGYKEALKLTLAYNNPKSQILGFKAFFRLGAPLFHQFRRSSKTEMNSLLTHPLILACNLLNSLSSSPVHVLLLENIIAPLCDELIEEIESTEESGELSEKSNDLMEIEIQLLSHPFCNNPLIIHLFSLIPDDYNFRDDSLINGEVIKAYLNYVYDSCPAVPYPDGQVLTAQEEMRFIQTIDAIPHAGLKKAILLSIMNCFYMDIENDHLKMKAFWPCLHRLENRFCVDQGAATEALIILLVMNDSEDFIREIREPSPGLEKFPELVKVFFEKFPGYLNSLKVPSYELLNVYHALFKLFIGQHHMIRLIKDSIENEYVKAELKLSKT